MLTATTILASHDGHHFWPLLWLFWLTLIGLLIFLFARRGRRDSGAKAILSERYARGEISADEYRERLANLK